MTTKHSGSVPPGLSSAVEALIEHERNIVPQDTALRSRVLARADEALRQSPPTPRTGPRLPGQLSKGMLKATVAIAVAGGIAAALYLSMRGVEPSAPRAAILKQSAPAQPSASSPIPPPSSTERHESAPEGLRHNPASAEAGAPNAQPAASNRRQRGSDELALLSRARTADAVGDFAAVLGLVNEHERSHPGGRLAEEREVLRVKALVGLGRSEQARRAAARFRRQFPRSVLLHRVDEMVPSAP